MKRRLLAAVLPVVATVMLAGTGALTSAAAGEIESVRGEPWAGSRGITESVASIAARQRIEDRRTAGRSFVIRERPEPGEGDGTRPKLPGPGVPRASFPASGQPLAGPSSSLSAGVSFLGAQVSESGFIPPDSMGSVGPTQVLVAVNGRIKVFDKQGNLGPLDVSDSTFFNSVRNGAQVTDPQVEYDRLSGRWFISEVNLESSNNRVMLAVSSGPTITGSSDFTFFSFNQNDPPPAGASPKFADYPQMGVDKSAVYIGVNDFTSSSGGFSGTSAFVVRKSSVLGAGPIVVTAFRDLAVAGGPGPFSPQPAQNMDPSVNEGYIVGVDNAEFSLLDVRRVTDPGGTPAISGNLSVAVLQTTFPEPVPAQGTTGQGLDALDDRLFEAMIARNPSGVLSLWTSHNIEVNSSGIGSSSGNRDGSRWYELGTLSTTPTLVQSGTLFDPAASSPRYFWIPSIAANGQGHASLNTSTAGSGRFAEIASTGRLSSDAAGATQPFEITQTSSSSYNLGSGPVKRWGDYSQTVVDPTDNQTFWTFQEYANATNSWGVRVIQLNAPPPATPTAASPSTVPPGQPSVAVEVTGTSSDGSGFFDPGPDSGGPGFPNHISATVSGGVDVNGVTYTDPTHVTLDLDTTGASNGSKDVTVTNPDGQSSTGSNLLVVGSDTTPPDPPTLNGTNPGSPANDNSPKVFGAAEGGSTVRLYTDAACTAGPVGTGGATTFASPGIPADSPPVADNSTTTFHATATDASNNTSSCSSSSVTYVEDSTAPGAPTSLATSPTSPANDNSPEVSGSAEAGSSVGVYKAATTADCTEANLAATGSAASFASPGLTASVADNTSTTFRATATDAAGNASLCSSDSVTYVEDSMIPEAPIITATDPASPSNSSTTPKVIGTADAETVTVEVFTQAGCAGASTSNNKAAFEGGGIEVTVGANQTTQLSARALDAVSNASACSNNRAYTHDSIPPTDPTLASPSHQVNVASNDTTVEVTFSGATDSLSGVDGFSYEWDTSPSTTPDETKEAEEDATGTTSDPLADGNSHWFHLRTRDNAGNWTSTVHLGPFVIDTVEPTAPTITATDPVSPSNSATTPKVIGTASVDTDTVRIYTQAGCGGSVAATGTKAAFEGAGIQVTVGANQTTQLSAEALDTATNASTCSNDFPYTHDSTPPAAPSITATNPASPSNSSITPKVIGTASADTDMVRIYTEAGCGGSIAANGTRADFVGGGIPVTVDANQTTQLSAKALDSLSNASSCSNNLAYTHDSMAPAEVTLTDTDPNSPANDNNPEVKGTAKADSTVNLYRAATSFDCILGNLAATGSAASFASPGLTASVADNTTTTFRATATDPAGNTSDCSSSSIDYTEDSTAPPAPTPPSPSPSPPPSPLPDTTPPNGSVSADPKQKAGAAVVIEVGCDEPCTALATGLVVAKAKGLAAVSAKKRKFKLKAAGAAIAAGQSVTLKLAPKGKKAKRKKSKRLLRKLVKRGAKAKAKITVALTDLAGNSTTETLVVKLKK